MCFSKTYILFRMVFEHWVHCHCSWMILTEPMFESRIKWPFFPWLIWIQGWRRNNKMSHMSQSCFLYLTCLYSLLLHVQHCYHLLIGEFPNKILESLSFKEYYRDDRIKLEKLKIWTKSEMKLVQDVCPISGTVPENMGQVVTLI